MPWLALPYEKREGGTLRREGEGIPTFAVINPDGTIVTADGRSKVSADPTGANFPDALATTSLQHRKRQHGRPQRGAVRAGDG